MLRILIQCGSYPPMARVVDSACESRERSTRGARVGNPLSQAKGRPVRRGPVRAGFSRLLP
jgi:hypothetical protein